MVTLSDAQSNLMRLLTRRMTPQQIMGELDWSSTRLYAVMKELTTLGLLRSAGELPPGAESLTWPSQEWIDGCALALPALGWGDALVKRLMRYQSRAGQFPPEADERYGYSRTDWTGHAVRRVEWGDWVVQGLILPRPDSRYWKQAAPDFRAVSLCHLPANNTPLLDEGNWWIRGRIVPIAEFRRDTGGFTLKEEVALTMAVAWVVESRALLDVEALEMMT